MKRSVLLFLVLLASVAVAQQPPTLTAEEILEKNLEATGGREAWIHVTSVVKTGTRESHLHALRSLPLSMAPGDTKSTLRMYQAPPDRYLYLEDIDKLGTITYGCHGEQQWWSGPNGPGQKKGAAADCETAASPVPARWSDRYERMQVKGARVINGKNTYEVKLTHKGHTATFFYEADSFLLRRITGVVASGGIPAMARQLDFSDYREVQGVRFAFAVNETYDYGTIDTRYDQILVNVAVADAIFQPPKSK